MQSLPHIHIDLSQFDARTRQGHWQDIMPTHRIALTGDAAQPAAISSWLLDKMALGHSATCGMRLRRSAADIRRDQIDHYAFGVNASGSWRGEAEDRDFSVSGAGVFVMDMARSMQADITDMNTVQLVVPRDLLDANVRTGNLHGLVLHGGAQGLLHDHILSLHRRLPHLTPADASGVARATLALLAASIRPTADTLAEAAPIIDSLRLTRARRTIRANLHDPSLNAGAVSRSVGTSRSRLYQLFKPFGGVSHYIQEQRLAQVHDALIHDADRGRVADIAARLGFTHSAQFSRMFRARYGMSPTALRKGSANSASAHTPGSADSTLLQWLQNLAHRC